jgi:uncharacterized membrane protein YfcA
MVELLIGALAGLLSGLLGIGGATIIVPALVWLLGVNQLTAQGTSLWVIAPTAIVGALIYNKHQSANLPMALLITLGAIVGAIAGASAAQVLPAPLLKRLFGVFLVLMGLQMFRG